jgi:hypothetical protein
MLPIDTVSRLALAATLLLAGPAFADGPTPKPNPKPRVVINASDLDDCSGKGFSSGRRTWLGVETSSLTPELRRHFGVGANHGVLISRVLEDSPAARAGLEVGDVLTEFGNDDVTDPHTLGRALRSRRTGERIELEVYRDAKRQTLQVALGDREICSFDVGALVALDQLKDLDQLKNLGHLEHLGALEGLEALKDLQIDIAGVDVDGIVRASLATALGGLHEALSDDEFRRGIERLKEVDTEELERRMREVQRELTRLERQLEAEGGEYKEMAREARERAQAQVREAQREMEKTKRDIEREVERALREKDKDTKGDKGGKGGGGSRVML